MAGEQRMQRSGSGGLVGRRRHAQPRGEGSSTRNVSRSSGRTRLYRGRHFVVKHGGGSRDGAIRGLAVHAAPLVAAD
jgi:hypothetical protein